MNKRQIKKKIKKESKVMDLLLEEEYNHCQECGKKLDRERNSYQARYGTCNADCYMVMVGMSWSDFI